MISIILSKFPFSGHLDEYLWSPWHVSQIHQNYYFIQTKVQKKWKESWLSQKTCKQKGTASQLITSEKRGQGKRKMKVIKFVSQCLKTKKCISFWCVLWEMPPIFTPLTNSKIIVIWHEMEFFSLHLFVTNITKLGVIFIYQRQKIYNLFV